MTLRILVLYVTAGAGHRRAAEAVTHALSHAFPQAAVECHDLLEDVPRWLRRAYPETYYALVRFLGWFWGLCFEAFDHPLIYSLVQPFRHAWNRRMARRCIQRLQRDPPDVIIATHFFPADVVS